MVNENNGTENLPTQHPIAIGQTELEHDGWGGLADVWVRGLGHLLYQIRHAATTQMRATGQKFAGRAL